jgi:alpha-L-rhamnosidase
MRFFLLIMSMTALLGSRSTAAEVEVVHLRCDYLENPTIDVEHPRLSWEMRSTERGQKQTAYQVVAADAIDQLTDTGNLWDSGKIQSDQSIQIAYAGKSLVPGMTVNWKVRVWDKDGVASAWSKPAIWCQGPMSADDWHGKWISFRKGPTRAELVGHNGYHSQISKSADTLKWVMIDLGKSEPINAVKLYPTRDYRWAAATDGLYFPVRYRVEISDDPSFATSTIFADRSAEDQPNPVHSAVGLNGPEVSGRYVRLSASKLGKSGDTYALALGQMQVLRGGNVLSDGADVSALDSVGGGPWAMSALVDGITTPTAPTISATAPKPVALEPWFRKTISLEKKPRRAIAYIASLGYHELYIDGRKIGDGVLAPAVSELSKRGIYVAYDITDQLDAGANCIGIWLGYGWYRTSFPGVGNDSPSVLAEIVLTADDGSITRVVTDESWKCHESPLQVITLHSGRGVVGDEEYDASKEMSGWATVAVDESKWSPVTVLKSPRMVLSAQQLQPNRITETIPAAVVTETTHGVYKIDMGKSLAGFFEMNLTASPGQRIDLAYDSPNVGYGGDEGFGQKDVYIARGSGQETFRNHFDYRAFRYVTVRGLTRPPVVADARACQVRCDTAPVAEFSCSNDLLNRIHATVDWTYQCVSMGGNTVDCPHRERLGYGAEGQTTMLTAMTHYDTAAMYAHWVQVWRDGQDLSNGLLTHTAPVIYRGEEGSPGWAGIIITLPWEMYCRYGDRQVLEETYPAIQRWLKFIDSKTQDHILQHYGPDMWGFFGDWVAPGRQLGGRWTNAVPRECDVFFNNCYTVYVIDLTARIADVLGKVDDAKRYREDAALRRAALDKKFFDIDRQQYVNGEQPYQAIALLSEVVPPERRPQVDAMLRMLILDAQKGHLNSGVLGTFFMFRYLQGHDHNDLIETMVNQETFPGWGWLLGQGATTIGEQWGGGFSQIHSSFLSVNSWFIEGAAGIQSDEGSPGYKHFFIRPAVVNDLTWVNAHFDSIRGRIVSGWKRGGGEISMDLVVPANTTATISIPTLDPTSVKESGAPAAKAVGVKRIVRARGGIVCDVEAGEYHFSAKY